MSCTDKQDTGSDPTALKEAARKRGHRTYSPDDTELHDTDGHIIWCKFYNLIIPQCQDCHEEFAIDYDGQNYWQKIGHAEIPKRCKSCHKAHKKKTRNELPAIHPQSQANDQH
ncbi:zinc-ribbon domain containing protein [Patescibacteria group bacterium]|nr:zinc-ribbon domain containing protein [Patescibacteria group bacterium]